MMARLGSLTPLALVSARPARVCRWRAQRQKFVSGKTRYAGNIPLGRRSRKLIMLFVAGMSPVVALLRHAE